MRCAVGARIGLSGNAGRNGSCVWERRGDVGVGVEERQCESS